MKKHVGTGERVCGESGTAGYKERVDFGKIIGEYSINDVGESITFIPTTTGMIVYDKTGSFHMWPIKPIGAFE